MPYNSLKCYKRLQLLVHSAQVAVVTTTALQNDQRLEPAIEHYDMLYKTKVGGAPQPQGNSPKGFQSILENAPVHIQIRWEEDILHKKYNKHIHLSTPKIHDLIVKCIECSELC